MTVKGFGSRATALRTKGATVRERTATKKTKETPRTVARQVTITMIQATRTGLLFSEDEELLEVARDEAEDEEKFEEEEDEVEGEIEAEDEAEVVAQVVAQVVVLVVAQVVVLVVVQVVAQVVAKIVAQAAVVELVDVVVDEAGRCRGGHAGGGYSQWDELDVGHAAVPDFQSIREPGLHLPDGFIPTCEEDFFKLFFTDEVIASLVTFTNQYAWMHIAEHPSLAEKDGSWRECTSSEITAFIAALIYFGLVRVGDINKYWSTETLYHGLWARSMLTRDRFRAIRAFFQCSPPVLEDNGDPLRKVRYLYDHINAKCGQYWQPQQHLSVDERMIRFKGRQKMKVYVKKKTSQVGVQELYPV